MRVLRTSLGVCSLCLVAALAQTGCSEEIDPVSQGFPPPTPAAAFSAAPTQGVAPFTVDFTDQSANATSWLWDFGDGSVSAAQNPSHEYVQAGKYSVRLTVGGTGGTDVLQQPDLIEGLPSIQDPGFELQIAGQPPAVPWTELVGASGGPSGHAIRSLAPPNSSAPDNGMPSTGVKWCEISAQTTDDALPPSNPGGQGQPPIGGAGVEQVIHYSNTSPVLQLEAAFVNGEDGPTAPFNDWMSIDIREGTEGAPMFNLYYRDTFSTAIGGSVGHFGLPMTPVETVTANLAQLFPGSDETTEFTLSIQVGNFGDFINPSFGYADNLRLAAPPAVPLVADFSGLPLVGEAPLLVDFSDLSSGTPKAWVWDFGDDTASIEQNPSHFYALPGVYTVILTATETGSAGTKTAIDYITVNHPSRIAEFDATPKNGNAPLMVQFTNLSFNATSWLWNFGDPASGGANASTLQHPTHTFSSQGNYTISLTAFGPGGQDTEVKPDFISVGPPCQIAQFDGNPKTGTKPLTVNFVNQSTNAANFQWNFGDPASGANNTSTLTNPSHTYNNAGSYTVALTAFGPCASNTITKPNFITVNEPPPDVDFSINPDPGFVGLPVNVVGSLFGSSGPVTNWAWSFPGGNPSSSSGPSPNASTSYATKGTKTITLNATGPGGTDVVVKTVKIIPTWTQIYNNSLAAGTNGNCTGCHTGPITSATFSMADAGTAHFNMINKATTAGNQVCLPSLRIDDFVASNSALIPSVNQNNSCLSRAKMGSLLAGEVTDLIDWINAGAPNN